MFKLLICFFLLAILGACSSSSGSSSSSSTSSSSSSSSGNSEKLDEFICEAFTEYPITISGEAVSQLGTELVFSNFMYRSVEGSHTVLYASTGAAMIDRLRMELGEYPLQDISTAQSSDVLLTLNPQGVSLTLATANQAEAAYELACENLFTPDENTCPSIIIDSNEGTITFTETQIGESLTINGNFTWDIIDEYNLGFPSCLPPANKDDMLGLWDSTQEYAGGITDVKYIEVTETEVIKYDYRGDNAARGTTGDCYTTVTFRISDVDEKGTFELLDEIKQESFDYLFRRTGDNRTQTFATYLPATLKPTDKKSADFNTCSP